jgi:hypothetical protein
LLEPQRTNVFTYSNTFSNAAWDKGGVTLTGGQVGVNTSSDAFLMTEDSANSVHRMQQTPVISGVSTISVYAKANTRNFLYLRGVQSSVNARAWFNLSTGTVGTLEGGATAKMTASANGYYRCEMTLNHDLGFELYIGMSSTNGGLSYQGNGTGSIFIQNAQAEVGSYATSYIPTLGASVTRVADAASKTGISSLIGQTEGTLFFDIQQLYLTGDRTVCIIWGGSGASYIQIFLVGDIRVIVNGSLLLQGQTVAANTRYKIAIAYKNGSHAFYVNGVQLATSASSVAPTVLNDYYLGNGFGTEQSGTYNQALIFKTRLTNAQLAELTTI